MAAAPSDMTAVPSEPVFFATVFHRATMIITGLTMIWYTLFLLVPAYTIYRLPDKYIYLARIDIPFREFGFNSILFIFFVTLPMLFINSLLLLFVNKSFSREQKAFWLVITFQFFLALYITSPEASALFARVID